MFIYVIKTLIHKYKNILTLQLIKLYSQSSLSLLNKLIRLT